MIHTGAPPTSESESSAHSENNPWRLAEQAANLLGYDLTDPMNKRLKGQWLQQYKTLLATGKSVEDLLACQAWELSGYGLVYHRDEAARAYMPSCLAEAWARWARARPTSKPPERPGGRRRGADAREKASCELTTDEMHARIYDIDVCSECGNLTKKHKTACSRYMPPPGYRPPVSPTGPAREEGR